MIKRTVIALVVVVVALAAAVVALRPELFTAAGRRARALREIERSVVVRRSCGSMETYVAGPQWQALSQSGQQEAAQALAEYCGSQGSAGQMTIIDAESKRKLALWDGSTFQRF